MDKEQSRALIVQQVSQCAGELMYDRRKMASGVTDVFSWTPSINGEEVELQREKTLQRELYIKLQVASRTCLQM